MTSCIKYCNVRIFRKIMDIMVKGSGSIREGRAEDGKLCSHLEWPNTGIYGNVGIKGNVGKEVMLVIQVSKVM